MKIYIIMGHEYETFDTLLVTTEFNEKRFSDIIMLYSKYFTYGVSLSCYEDEEELFVCAYHENDEIIFDECIYPKEKIVSSYGIEV